MLLLPALSSISTRDEMRPLLECLAARFRVTSVDWPGFGTLPRARPHVHADLSPISLSAFLADVLVDLAPSADLVVAAGHAAGYALAEAAARPGRLRGMALVAPTWRGPLPTMTGAQKPWFATLRRAFDAPVLGPLLYRANVSRPMLRMMAREHVYQDAAWLTAPRMAAKEAVTRAPGARHASVRFVTGALDLVASRQAFLALAQGAGVPILSIRGAGTPRRSRAEMEALERLPCVRSVALPQGRLAVGEEYPQEVAAAVGDFFASL